MDQRIDQFELSDSEIEQAMVLNKCSQDMLCNLLGLATQTQSLSSLVLWLEIMQHGEHQALRYVRDIGQQEGKNMLAVLRPVICDQWKYCQRRSTDGFGDPRRFIRLLAPIIGSILYREEVTPCDRIHLIIACVFVTRANLSSLCQCKTATKL